MSIIKNRKLEKPNIVRLNIQLTKKCNQKCKSCNGYEIDSTDELSLDEIKSVIKQSTENFEIRNIALTGGEPTLNRNILEIASYARQFCEKVSVTTNGYYCSTNDRILELVEAGINRFSFSYHGIGCHDDFVGLSGSEKRIRKAVSYLSQIREEKGVYVKIGTLFTGKNISDVEEMLKFAESNGVDLYIELLDTMIPIFAQSKLAKEDYKNNDTDIEYAVSRIREWIEQGRRVLCDYDGLNFIKSWFNKKKFIGECPLWSTDLYVGSQGSIYPGCWYFPPIGNIREKSIKEIYMGDEFVSTVEKMKQRKCGYGCTCGYLMQSKYIDFNKMSTLQI